MPARPSVANVAQVLFKGTVLPSSNWVNKLFVRYTGTTPLTLDLNNYAEALMASWVANVTPLQAPGTDITEVEVTDLASDMGSVGFYGTGALGDRVGGILPADAAFLISYKVARHYRGGHPRTYLLCGTQTDLQTPGTWTGDFEDSVATAWGVMQAALIVPTGSFNPAEQVNVSYFGGAAPVDHVSAERTVPLVDSIITAGTKYSHQLASQRRRIGRK